MTFITSSFGGGYARRWSAQFLVCLSAFVARIILVAILPVCPLHALPNPCGSGAAAPLRPT
eukprot:6544254-Prymnesium_polylepis.1